MVAAWVAVGVGQGLQIHLQPALHVEGLEGQCLPPHLQLELAELQRPEQHEQQPLLLHAGLSLALEPPEVQLHRQHWQLILLLQLQEQLHFEHELQLLLYRLHLLLPLPLVHPQGKAVHLSMLLGLHEAQHHGLKRCAKLPRVQS